MNFLKSSLSRAIRDQQNYKKNKKEEKKNNQWNKVMCVYEYARVCVF